jgi:molybdenum cofactor cytidylyltransferase
VRTVTVVTGADAGVEPAARAFAERIGEADRLRLVHCADHAEGMGASLRAGVESLPDDAAGVLVFLGDMPLIPHGILPELAAAVAGGAPAAAPFHGGRRGHPVLFSQALFADLRASQGGEGARAVLQTLGPRLACVATLDVGVLFDVDQPGDIDRTDER